jgi:hypothetical protein
MALVAHPYIMGAPHRLKYFRAALAHIRAYHDVRPCCTDQLVWGLGPGSVEGLLLCESGTWRSLVRVAPPQSLRERQSGLSSPRWEGATPIHNSLGCPLCHSKPMPIAVITSPSSRIG